MATIQKGVESTAETVRSFERDMYHAYVRTNIVRIDEPDTEDMQGKHCWQYDEETMTLSEYMDRLETKQAQQDTSNLDTMTGLAELYEALYAEEVV